MADRDIMRTDILNGAWRFIPYQFKNWYNPLEVTLRNLPDMVYQNIVAETANSIISDAKQILQRNGIYV